MLRLTAENRLTSEEKFFCDPFFFYPRKHFIENIRTVLPVAGLSEAHGPPPLVRAVSRISAAGRQRAPDTPAKRGRARPERYRVPGTRAQRASTILGPGLQGQMGQSRLHLPASSGMLRRPQPGWRRARPTAPGCFAAPLAFGYWFSPSNRRGAYKSRAAGFAAK